MTLRDTVNRVTSFGIATSANEFKPAFGASVVTTNNSSLAAASGKVPTATAPETSVAAGRAVVEVASHTLVDLLFFGAGDADETGSYRVWAWFPCNLNGTLVYIPKLLLVGTVTLSAAAATALVASGRMADAVVVSNDYTPSANGAVVKNPTDSAGYITLDPGGAAFLEVELTRADAGGDGADSLGALVRVY